MKNNEKQQSWNVFSSPYLIFHAFQMLAIFFIKVYVHICTVVNTVCKDLHAYLYNCPILFTNIYMFLSYQREAPGRPWWEFITPAGKMHDKLCAFTDANTDAKQWFWMVSYGFQCFCMVSMMLSMIYTIVSTCFIGFQDFSLGPPS